jgi:hypothetical protein
MEKARLPLILILLCLTPVGCSKLWHKTALVCFGFDDPSGKSEEVTELVKTWSSSPPCPYWRVTTDPKSADYRVLVGDVAVTIVDRQGQVIYSGGQGVMYANGNTDGSGISICKLTGE